LDGAIAFFSATHGDEAKAAAAAGFTVSYDFSANDGAMGGEEIGEFFILDRPREIADIEFHKEPRFREEGVFHPRADA
jgi:hypothetical protein